MYTVDELVSEYKKDQLVSMANYYNLDSSGKTKREVAELLVEELEKEVVVTQSDVVEVPKYSVRVKRIMESKK